VGLVGIDTGWVKNDDDCFDDCCNGNDAPDVSGPTFFNPLGI